MSAVHSAQAAWYGPAAGIPDEGPSRGGATTRALGPSRLSRRVLGHVRVDWPGWLAMVTATLLYLVKGFEGPLPHDPGLFAYGAEQVARGDLPYLGVFNQTGPLGQLVPGIGVWVGSRLGVGGLTSARITMMVVSVAAVGAAYWAGKLLWSSRPAGTVSAFGLLSFQGFAHYATWGPREKTLMVLFVLLLMVAVARRSWIAVGVTVALATLTWQAQFLFTFPAVLVAVAAFVPGFLGKGKALGRVAIGGAVTTTLVVLPYLATGNLRIFWECFVLAPQATPQPGPFDGRLGEVAGFILRGFGVSTWLVVAGIIAYLVAAVLALTPSRRDRATSAPVVSGGIMLAIALGWSLLDFQNWPDLFVFLPFAALGLGWLVPANAPERARLVPAVAALLTLALTAVAGLYAFDTAQSHVLVSQRRGIRSVFAALPSDATVVSYFAPNVLAIVDKQNLPGVRVQYWDSVWVPYVDRTYPGGISAYVGHIAEQVPDLIVAAGGPHETRLPDFQAMLASYQYVGTLESDSFYVSKTLPAATRAAVAHAISQAR